MGECARELDAVRLRNARERGPIHSASNAANPKDKRAAGRLEELIKKHLATLPLPSKYFNVDRRRTLTDML